MIAYCHRDGRIGFGASMPPETLPLLIARRIDVMSLIERIAVLGADGATWTVPGLAEAISDEEAAAAVRLFVWRLDHEAGRVLNDGGTDAA